MADEQPLKDEYTEWAHKVKKQAVPIYIDGWDSHPEWHWFVANDTLLTDSQLPLLRKMGLPTDNKLAVINISGLYVGPKYKNFRVEFFGTLGGIWQGLERPADVVDDPRAQIHIVLPVPETPPRNPPRFCHINAWRGRIFMRGSNLFWERIWNANTKEWTCMMCNVLVNNDPDLKQATADAIRLAPALKLFTLSQNLNNYTNGGRPPKAAPAPPTVRHWWPQYNAVMDALRKDLETRQRGRRRLSKHSESGRLAIIKRAIPNIENSIATQLAKYPSAADVALRYTGWRCSQIEIGTWETTRYRDQLRESAKLNGINLDAKRKGTN